MQEKTLFIKVSNDCNMNCTYCYNNKYIDNNHPKPNFELIHNIIDKNKTITRFMFLGGEPLIYKKEIIKLLEHIRNDANYISVHFITNGTIYIKELKEYKEIISGIQISIDGWKDINDENRIFKNKKGSYDTILNNIYRYHEDGFKVNLESVIANPKRWGKNVNKLIEDLPKDANITMGISAIRFERNIKIIYQIKTILKIIKIDKKIKNKYKNINFYCSLFTDKFRTCPFGKYALGLDLTTGILYPCPIMIGMDIAKDQAVGKVTDNGVQIEEELIKNSIEYTKKSNYKIRFFPKRISDIIIKYMKYSPCYTDNKIITGNYFVIPFTYLVLTILIGIFRKKEK